MTTPLNTEPRTFTRAAVAVAAAMLLSLALAAAATAVRAPVLEVPPPSEPRAQEGPDGVLAAIGDLAPIIAVVPSATPAAGPQFQLTLRVDQAVLGATGQETARITFGDAVRPATLTIDDDGTVAVFQAQIPAPLISTPGSRKVAGQLCSQGASSCLPATQTATFTIQPVPTPTISALAPASLPAGSPATTIAVIGTGFGPTSRVLINGNERPTTFDTPSRVTVGLTTADLNAPGPIAMKVATGSIEGNTQTFTVEALPTPTIAAVTPSTVPAGSGETTLTVQGANFRSGSRVLVSGTAYETDTAGAPTTLTAVLPAAIFVEAIDRAVVVSNPPNRGGNSASSVLTVAPYPTPTIASINPVGGTAGSDTTLTIQGSGFRPASRVFLAGTAYPTTINSSTSVTAQIPGAALALAGNKAVLVSNPPDRGGNSATAIFTVFAAPTISSLSPPTVGVGSGALTLTINGDGFDPQADIQINGQDVATTRVSATKLTTPLTTAQLATPGTLKVRVQNPPGRGGNGPAEDFTIEVAPTPIISAVSPGAVTVGSPAISLAVIGSDFHPASVVSVNGQPRATTYRSTNRLDAQLTAADLAAVGTLAIKVTSPGSESGTTEFTVLPVGQTPPADPGIGPIPEPVVAAVPTVPPTIGEISDGPAIPGEVISIAGQNFGAEQGAAVVTIGGEVAEGAAGWSDGRIDIRVPDLPAGTTDISITTAAGVITVPVTVAEQPVAPPIGNPVLLPGDGATVIFDASTAIDPATGAGAPGDASANAAGLSGIAAVLWSFGDGTTSSKTTVSKTYTAPGTYKPSVTITTDAGARSTTPAGTVRVVRGSSGGLVAELPPVNFAVPSKVVFDAGRATIRPESRSYLVRLADLVKRVGRRTEIGGHTDSVGSFSLNQDLSTERARAVRSFLVNEGKVPKGLLTATGYGETRPIDSNDTALGRQRNRRVELRIPRGGTPIRLTSRQLLINQRISQIAVARAAALEARLTGGLDSADIRNGSISAQDFGPSVAVSGTPALDAPAKGAPEPVKVTAPKRSGGKLKVSVRQLLINQRISQAAVRRVNRLDSVLDAGLTGAAVSDGAVTGEDLVPGIAATPLASVSGAQGDFVLPAITAPSTKKSEVRATQEQLIINQRVSQAAIRRLNLMIARMEKGLTSADFQDGSLTSAQLAK